MKDILSEFCLALLIAGKKLGALLGTPVQCPHSTALLVRKPQTG